MPSAAARRGKPRASRFSSPRTRNGAPSKTQAHTVSAQWVEPTLKDSKPSYEEHGGSPYGVLEDMQALGQPPTAKVKTRVKGEPLRKSLGRSLGLQQGASRVTEDSPSVDTPRSTSVVQEIPAPAVQPMQDDNTDLDFNPRASRRSARSRRNRAGSATSETNKPPSPAAEPVAPAMADDVPPLEAITSPVANELSEMDIERVNFRIVVDIACKRAKELGFDDFGAALRQVYAESETNERYAHLLRSLLLQSASTKDKLEFTNAIKRAKRTLRKATDAGEAPLNDLHPPELNGRRHRSGSRSRSSKPELVPRPSIENVPKIPKLRLSMRKRSPKDNEVKTEEAPERSGTRSQRTRRADSHSSASSLSQPSSPSSSELELIIPGARADAASMLRGPNGLSMNSTPITLGASGLNTVNGSDDMHRVESQSVSNGSAGSGLDGPLADSGLQGSGAEDGFRSRSTTLYSVTESLKAQIRADRLKHWPDQVADEDQIMVDDTSIEEDLAPDTSGTDRLPKRSPVDAGFDQGQLQAIEETKRRKLDETLYQDPGPASGYRQSHIRESTENAHGVRAREHHNHRPTIRLSNGTANNRARRGRDQTDSPLSDMSSTPPMEDAMAGTQATRIIKKAKTKQSPEKKHNIQAGGLDDRSGTMGSVAGVDAGEESDNNDYCNACGGTGDLLCCDGCTNSFHFTCVDPPLSPNSPELAQQWFCPSCIARRQPPTRQPRGLFAQLLNGLEKRNPINFSLPESLRSYFAGVHTGKDGKFDDPANVKTRSSRAGYDEPMDTLKTKDNKGNAILCYACGTSAAGKRDIITCDICGNHWHLDCTNPPLANPPFRDQHNRKTKEWMCPLHVEHDLAAIDPIRLSQRRRVHVRRPKNAKIVDTSLRRGLINNGIIDIINDSSSDDDSEFEEDETASGTVFRVPSKGVKFDFIDKVHRTRAVEGGPDHIPSPKSTRMNAQVLQAQLDSRPVLERQFILSLVQLGSEQQDINLGGDAIHSLINTMTAEAPAEVIAKVAADEDETMTNGMINAPASNSGSALSDDERKQLEALQELIKRRLEAAGARASGGE
ncbi:hypothetical protein K461DRAFT_278720 [Myriangium duriaei CBS 260.36]|uniref:PHD-type domain-containing protein n=1 Tax=Myriangium duriaei CBS 260.36 TaxID=1168546 RepID=A0A9P4MFK3_9PEZI|nr:hypothetical protein K461DRAFT_278720 [Myriangium duriaei CBS 260.36]